MPRNVTIRDDLYHAQQTSSNYRFEQSTIDWQGDLASQYRKLARRANRRLINLEAYSHDKGFKGIKELAYKGAMYDIHKRYGNNRRRYRETLDTNLTQMQQIARIQDVLRFLNSVSSTKQGIIQVYQKRVDTLNQKYPGLNMTWEELAHLSEKGILDDLKQKWASDDMWETIARQKRTNKQITKILEEQRRRHPTGEELDKIYEIIENLEVTPETMGWR